MKDQGHKPVFERGRAGLVGVVLLAGLASGPVLAQDPALTWISPLAPAVGAGEAGTFIPYPLTKPPEDWELRFDLGGSDEPKLRLQLTEPLSIGLRGGTRAGPGETTVLAAGSALQYDATDQFSLIVGADLVDSAPDFQPVGRIHCENGTLDSMSYRADDCYFVDNISTLSAGAIALGSRFRMNDNVSAAINLFHTESAFDSGILNRARDFATDASGRGFLANAAVLPGLGPGLETRDLDTRLTGVDLEFQVGVSTDRAGDMVVGLQLTRVLDGDFTGVFRTAPGVENWTIAEPLDSARLSFDWAKGPFSGGVQTYYRAPVEFLNRGGLDSYATFDVHFSWRAPWNASLSVGASNLLGDADDDTGNNGKLGVDPFESIYGRIPYVRYKQDL